MEDGKKKSAADQDHAAVDGSGAGPMHGSGYRSVAIDDGLHGGRQLARRRRGGLQEFEERLRVVGCAGPADDARGSAGHGFGFRVRRWFKDAIERDHFAGWPILEEHGLARSAENGCAGRETMGGRDASLFAHRLRHGGQCARGGRGIDIKLRPAATPAAPVVV